MIRFFLVQEIAPVTGRTIMYVTITDCHTMKWKIINLQTRLYLVTATIMLVGLGSAILIYLTAKDASENMMIYEFEHSNKYRHDLELYAGKWNVLADELSRWFDGLWHGQTLAFTIACITVFISLIIFIVAYHLPADTDSVAGGENKQDGTDLKR